MTDSTGVEVVTKSDQVSKIYSTQSIDFYADPTIALALEQEIARRAREGALVALKVLRKIAEDETKPSQARVSAAKALAEIAHLTGAHQASGSSKDPSEMTLEELRADLVRLDRIEAELGQRARVIRPSEPIVDPELVELLS